MSFSLGDKVRIFTFEHFDEEGLIRSEEQIYKFGRFYVVQIGMDTPEPFTINVDSDLIRPYEQPKTTEEKMSEIKDSGERTEFETGAVRDMHEGKGDMLSVPWAAMLRVSKHYENGAKKYGRYNYLKGIPVSSFIDSAFRHLAKYVAGYDDEDHLSAAAFNILGAIQMEEHRPEMMDIPWREGKRCFHYEGDNKTEEDDSENV